MSDNPNSGFPLVSIIIPAKNEERDFGLCLGSLKALDYPADRLEIILVDNGSTDRTRDIAREQGVVVLRDDEATIAGLRNIGAEQAGGSILGFLDADMEVARDWLKHAVEALSDPEVGAVGGLLLIPEKPTWVEKAWSLKRTARPYRGSVPWLGSGNLVMRKDVFEAVGRWNETLRTCEDLDLCGRIKTKYKLIHYAPVAAIHHGGDKTLSGVFKKEIWRGSNNFDNLGERIRNPKELPTLVFPSLHGMFILAFILALFLNRTWALFLLPLVFLFPALRAAFVVFKSRKPLYFFHLLCIWSVYYTARSVAPFFRKPV